MDCSSKDFVNEFRTAFVGTSSPLDSSVGSVAYSDTIRLDVSGAIDRDSAMQALNAIPTDEPSVNSRIILLVAHSQHAFKILRVAADMQFQTDTVWIGPSSWAGRTDPTVDLTFWLPDIPGYMGIAPFQNQDTVYTTYMSGLQEWQRARNKTVLSNLPAFARETVDAIIVMAAALANTPANQRSDGTVVVKTLRNMTFQGVSGFVEFTESGDRKNPLYSILNVAFSKLNDGGELLWIDAGTVGPEAKSANIKYDKTCFVEAGCGFDNIPDDSYPEEKMSLPWWILLLLLALGGLLVGVTIKYWRSHKSKSITKAELKAFQQSIVGLRTAESDYMPNATAESRPLTALSVIPPPVIRWCWKETEAMMHSHDDCDIFGDPSNCWILYSKEQSKILESCFLKRQKTCSPLPGYTVQLEKMIQTKNSTGFKRDVARIVESGAATARPNNQGRRPSQVYALPDDLKGEPQMVLIEGDLVQISKQRNDGFAFGTKLHHRDEEAARLVVKAATDLAEFSNGEEPNVFPDTGWFPLTSTRMPTAEELKTLSRKVNSGALDPPSNWAPIQDKTVTQRHLLKEGSPERTELLKSFFSTLRGQHISIVKVERVQNLAMFQSYIVKRQTVCYRETGEQDTLSPEIQQKALRRFERRWLWHGTNPDAVEKILNQGFNRSFCGKNATAYGKGVYFARDASYSAHQTYSAPDRYGNQYMIACSVCVGEYCRGKHDALTPDVRDARNHSLYDTTVGLTSSDTMANPSIYVTYHDAQAYPEYLITFQQPSCSADI